MTVQSACDSCAWEKTLEKPFGSLEGFGKGHWGLLGP